MIIFKVFFFQSDRPTQYQETNSTLNAKKKKGGGGGGWPNTMSENSSLHLMVS